MAKRKTKADQPFRLSRTAEDKLFAELRGQGEDEMRRRWREAEAKGVLKRDPHRALFLREVEKTAEAARPANIERIRESMGEREAEFRQGLANEASSLLRRVFGNGYRLGEIGRGEWFQQNEKGR